MKRYLALVAGLVAVAVTVAACGAKSSASTAPSTVSTTVGSRQVAGLGKVLIDAAGMPLYVNDQDGAGMPTCNGACAAIWKPLTVTGTPTGTGVSGKLGVVQRSDGSRQVTLAGRPLYTFVADSSGAVTGNGVHDQFADKQFSWHAMLADGTTPPASASPSPTSGSGSGSGSSSGGSSGGGGYGY